MAKLCMFSLIYRGKHESFMEGTLEFHEFVFLKPLGAPKL